MGEIVVIRIECFQTVSRITCHRQHLKRVDIKHDQRTASDVGRIFFAVCFSQFFDFLNAGCKRVFCSLLQFHINTQINITAGLRFGDVFFINGFPGTVLRDPETAGRTSQICFKCFFRTILADPIVHAIALFLQFGIFFCKNGADTAEQMRGIICIENTCAAHLNSNAGKRESILIDQRCNIGRYVLCECEYAGPAKSAEFHFITYAGNYAFLFFRIRCVLQLIASIQFCHQFICWDIRGPFSVREKSVQIFAGRRLFRCGINERRKTDGKRIVVCNLIGVHQINKPKNNVVLYIRIPTVSEKNNIIRRKISNKSSTCPVADFPAGRGDGNLITDSGVRK